MAGRKLVSSLSTQARSVFLLNSNPKRFSTKPQPDRRSHWSTEYRRRLGINDDDLVLSQHPLAIWRPPRDGKIKINICALLSGDHRLDDDGSRIVETGAIAAIARNPSGEVLGVTAGLKKHGYGHMVSLQLYALKASANLAEELRSTGMHGGPVVYESASHALATAYFDEECVGEPQEVIRSNMPRDEDLEEFGRSCPVYCGTADRLKEILPDDLGVLFDVVERDKALAGLA